MSFEELTASDLWRMYEDADDGTTITAIEAEMARRCGFESADDWYASSAHLDSLPSRSTYTARSAAEDAEDIKTQPYFLIPADAEIDTRALETSPQQTLQSQVAGTHAQYLSVSDALQVMDSAISSYFQHGSALEIAEGLPHPGGVVSGGLGAIDPAERIYLPIGTPSIATDSLCEFCTRLDFRYILANLVPAQQLSLGMLKNLVEKQHCAFCRLVKGAIRMSWGTQSFPLQHNGKDVEVGLKTVPKDDSDSLFDIEIVLHPLERSAYARIFVQRMADSPFHGRLIDLEMANLKIVKKWIHDCEYGSHQSADQLDSARLDTDNAFIPTYLIDVEKDCIVEVEADECRYVALSYVWGGPQPVQLLLANMENLAKEGSLSTIPVELPATILDAMDLVRGLGERYLWCDALCIVQDDYATKNMELNVMDKVYSFAVFTIIAGYGENVRAGLPRVRRTESRYEQHFEYVQGMKLANKLPANEASIDVSVWNTRAWTYQERILSRRKLFISECQMTWKCQHTEVELCEDVHSLPVQRFQGNRDAFWTADLRDADMAIPLGSVNTVVYATIVQRFTARHLSVPSDILGAFAGVANRLAPLFRDGFRFGLPKAELDTQLLWQPQGSIIRRKNPDTGLDLFPSWSWAGWIGPVTGNFAGRRSVSDIEFMHDSNNEWYTMQQARGVTPETQDSRWVCRARKGQAFWQEDQSTEVFYSHPVRISPGFRSSYRPSLMMSEAGSAQVLLLRASIARFRISGELNPYANVFLETRVHDSTNILAFTMHNDANQWVGTVFVPSSLTDIVTAGMYDCIRISTTSTDPELYAHEPSILMPPETCYDADVFKPATSRMDQIDILVVSYTQGTASRLGVGICHVRAFVEAEPKRRVIRLG